MLPTTRTIAFSDFGLNRANPPRRRVPGTLHTRRPSRAGATHPGEHEPGSWRAVQRSEGHRTRGPRRARKTRGAGRPHSLTPAHLCGAAGHCRWLDGLPRLDNLKLVRSALAPRAGWPLTQRTVGRTIGTPTWKASKKPGLPGVEGGSHRGGLESRCGERRPTHS
jgi:hypothetical protein